MPNANDPSPIIDPRLGSMLISAPDLLNATGPAVPAGTPLAFGPPAEAGEVGTLGPYRVVRELGRGGMGAVCLALDPRLDRSLALKVLLPEFAADAEAKARFLREARAAAKISHDNVVTVYEADERDGVPYIAMQLLHGRTLDSFLQNKGNPSLRHAVRIAREAALGLAAAHKLGIVHRDIKPANLWLEAPQGRVKLLDFGLARPDSLDTELTKSGAVVGTPAFMSPEQALGERVDYRTDLFSLGAVLYLLCTGHFPFEGSSVGAVLMALGTKEPKPVRGHNPKVPEVLADLIHRLLVKDPEGRPQSAAAVATSLQEISEQSASLSSAAPTRASSTPALAGSQSTRDPWTTRAVAGDGQRRSPTPTPGKPVLLPVDANTPMTLPDEEEQSRGQAEQAEPQKKEPQNAPGTFRTVISSGVVWSERREDAREEEAEVEPPDRPKRKKVKGKAKEKQGSSVPIFIGAGVALLLGLFVAVALIVPRGKPKEINSAGLETGNSTELSNKGREQPKAPATPSVSPPTLPAPTLPAPSLPTDSTPAECPRSERPCSECPRTERPRSAEDGTHGLAVFLGQDPL